MKRLIKVMLVAVPFLQIGVFIFGWNTMVSVAQSQDRFPPEWGLGMTLAAGFYGIAALFIICSILAAMVSTWYVRWGSIAVGLLVWGYWLWPSYASRPVAIPAFFLLGSGLLIVGSGLVIPWLKRGLESARVS